MKRHSLCVLPLFLGLVLLAGCHGGGSDDATAPDEPIPTDLPFTGTAAFGAVADPLKGLTIAFSTPMDPASVEQNLSLSQGSASEGVADAAVSISTSELTFHWNAAGDTVTIFGAFPYCEEFEVTIGAETANAAGAVAGEAQVIAFATRENPCDFDGVDNCQADLGFYLNGTGLVLLGGEVTLPKIMSSGDPVVVADLIADGDHWTVETIQAIGRLDNVTAEGRAMVAALSGESSAMRLSFWNRYAAGAQPASSLAYSEDVVSFGFPGSIPDLNGDGLNEISISQLYSLDLGGSSLPVQENHLIFGGSALRGAYEYSENPATDDLARLEGANLRFPAFAKGEAVQVGDFDGDGVKDLLYTFRGEFGNGLKSTWFIVYGPEVSREMWYVIPDGNVANYNFLAEHQTLISALTPPYLQDGAVGDFNGDGIDDIAAVGSSLNDAGNYVSDLYILFGVSGMRADRTLASAPVTRITCSFRMEPIISSGDLNADGYADLMLSGKGKIMAFLGQPTWAASYVLGEDINPVTFLADRYQNLGGMQMTGDIDNDGYQDLMIGANDGGGISYRLLYLGRDYSPGAKLYDRQADVIFDMTLPIVP